ncbi:type IV pilus twitching motility protein PilT [Gemmatimonas sp. UBA7669]|uniref:type IV pilus twitching motility protein PilT n=1 Tax=Gemmatimonas sp. UBA7669 TaxID=1946568 RepID=UPI0025C73FA0|nr:type IV pilus twitching motility protein PilT [Gemmatimonas sp. UBA7669]
MPQLDKLIARLESGVASAIVLESDSPIALQTGMGLQQFSSQVLSVSQVLALISEVADADVRPSIQSGRDIRFTYQFNGKPWLVQQDKDASGVRIEVRAWSERDNGAETPKPLNTAPRGVASVTPTAAPATPAVAPLAESSRSVPRRADDAPIAAAAEQSDARSALDALLRIQVSRGAADLHLRVGEPPIFRLGGDLVRLEGEAPLTPEGLEAMLRSIMPVKNQGEYEELWDTDFAYEIEGLSRFRVNVLRDRYGIAAVMRTIASTTVTVEQMGISPEVQALCNLTKGLVLVTGPTGSGKSTTLCALVDLINRTRSDHLITIEDPIEFVHQSKKCLITQRQVGVHTQSFKSALRAALREDPDIILVGELRDLETIAIAMETAETGHLVFGTLHTSTAASTINRIVDQFPADRQEQIRIMLSESLKAVVSQVLCRKIGGGRVAAREILIVNKAVSALIREGKTVQIPNIIQTQRKLGMETLNDALLNLVKTKQVEPEEAYNKAVEKKDMAMKLKAIGHNITSAGLDE